MVKGRYQVIIIVDEHVVQLAVKLTVLMMGNTNEAERNVFESEEVSVTEGETEH